MKKAESTVGVSYIARVSGRLVPVKIISESPHGPGAADAGTTTPAS